MALKLSNVIGVPIPQWLKEQFKSRSSLGIKNEVRSNQELIIMANKTAWVRVVSSVNIGKEDLNHFREKFNNDPIPNVKLNKPEDVAKSFILFAGTSIYKDKFSNTNEKTGFTQELRDGLNGSYGMMGKKEVYDYGYVPMPGITSVTVETMGRMGSIKSATINFKVFNKMQLDVVDALYFKLGYTMLLEWGHTYYYKTPASNTSNAISSTELSSTEELMIDPFVDGMNKEKIYYKISQGVKKSYGNYDGMLGVVTNFTFSRKEDGSYECVIKIIAMGALAESLKINRSDVYSKFLDDQIKKLVITENAERERDRKRELDLAAQERAASIGAAQSALEKSKANDKTLVQYLNEVYGSQNPSITPFNADDRMVWYNSDGGKDYTNTTSVKGVSVLGDKIWAIGKTGLIFNTIKYTPTIELIKYDPDRVFTKAIGRGFAYKEISNTFSKNDHTRINYNPYAVKSATDFSSSWRKALSTYTQFNDGSGTPLKGGNFYENIIKQLESNYKFFPETGQSNYSGKDFTNDRYFYSNTSVTQEGGLSVPSYFGTHILKVYSFAYNARGWHDINQYDFEKGDAGVQKNGAKFLSSNYTNGIRTVPYDFNIAISLDVKAASSAGITKTETDRSLGNITDYLNIQEAEYKKLMEAIYNDVIKQNSFTPSNVKGEYAKIVGTQYGPYIVCKRYIADSTSKYKDIPYYLIFNDSHIITELRPKDSDIPSPQKDITEYKKAFLSSAQDALAASAVSTTNQANALYNSKRDNINAKFPILDVEEAQKSEAGKYGTALEVALRSIQVYSLNKASQSTKKVQKITDTGLWETIFKEVGLYSQIYDKIVGPGNDLEDIDGYANESTEDNILSLTKDKFFEFYAKYGFNHNLLSGTYKDLQDGNEKLQDIIFNHKEEYFASYVIPYQVSQDFSKGMDLDRPVYIKLGTLLMLINHLALMYDKEEVESNNISKDNKKKTPIFYIDYNPKTNYCLSSINQLSTNPFEYLIPYAGNKDDFKKLFEEAALAKVKNPFDPQKKEYSIISELPEFLDFGTNMGTTRGKIMNVLIDIDYLLKTIKDFSSADYTNSVYLKPFMDTILGNMCKALGNYNLLRLAYSDAGNCFFIVDDQLTPVPNTGDKQIYTDTSEYDIPLFGRDSVARNFDIKTDISTRLSNTIALSANSQDSQAVMGSESTSFGFINRNYKDRYFPLKDDSSSERTSASTTSQTSGTNIKKVDSSPSQGDIETAQRFNDAIDSFYFNKKPSKDYVNGATNYYMSKLGKVKASTPATRATAIIPVSINFTTDGISGFNMYQAYTVDPEVLPHTYSIPDKDQDGNLRKVGFCLVGLTHTIENNQWTTAVKSNMVYLRKRSDYGEAVREKTKYENVPPIIDPPVSPSSPATTGPLNLKQDRVPYPGACEPAKDKGDTYAVNPDGSPKIQQVLDPNYVGTDNLKKTYPSANPNIFKKYDSNIDLASLGLTRLNESEITDDTRFNKFLLGYYRKKPEYFVMHHTAGWQTSNGKPRDRKNVYETFYCRGFPAHFVIDVNGSIFRFLPDGAMGAQVAELNSRTIGVEIMGRNNSEINEKQVNSAIRLAHYMGYNVEKIVGHGKIQSNKQPDEGYNPVKKINPSYTAGYDQNVVNAIKNS